MRKLLGLACVLMVLVLPATALSVTGRSARNVQELLERNGIPWSTGHEGVEAALCKGLGEPVTRRVRPFPFHKLDCWVLTDRFEEYKIRVTVKSSGGLRITFLKYTPGFW